MTIFIKCNTTKQMQTFTTYSNNQMYSFNSCSVQVLIYLYEGEHAMTERNSLLGKFEPTSIPPASCVVPQIEVTFDIYDNGIFSVSAVDTSMGKENKFITSNDKSHLSKEDIERMVRKLRSTKLKMRSSLEDNVSSKSSIESYSFNMKATFENEKFQGKTNDKDKQKILDKCNKIMNWLYKNMTAEKEEFEHPERNIQKKLKKVCNPIITKLLPEYRRHARRNAWRSLWCWSFSIWWCLLLRVHH